MRGNETVVESNRNLPAGLLKLHMSDNVAILKSSLEKGTELLIGDETIKLSKTLGMGHKLAIRPIAAGEDILKYGLPIGFAANEIPLGAHVHVHNLTSRYTTVEIME